MTLGPGQCQYVILALAMHGISVQTVHHMVFVMPRMSQQDRAIAAGLLEANWSVKAVARRLGVSPKAIRKLRDKFERTGAVQDLPRSGRPRVTTRRADSISCMTGIRHDRHDKSCGPIDFTHCPSDHNEFCHF